MEPLRWGIQFEEFPVWLCAMHRGMCSQLDFANELSFKNMLKGIAELYLSFVDNSLCRQYRFSKIMIQR